MMNELKSCYKIYQDLAEKSNLVDLGRAYVTSHVFCHFLCPDWKKVLLLVKFCHLKVRFFSLFAFEFTFQIYYEVTDQASRWTNARDARCKLEKKRQLYLSTSHIAMHWLQFTGNIQIFNNF